MRRYLVLLALLVASSLPGFSAWSRVQFTLNYCGGATGTGVTSCQIAITPTSGNLLVVVAMYNQSTPNLSTVTGMTGGTAFTRASACKVTQAGGGQTIDMMYSLSAGTVSSGNLTVTWTAGVDYPDLYVFEYTGGGATPAFDTCGTGSGTTNTVNGGSITTTGANDMALAVTTQSANVGSPTFTSSAPWPSNGAIINGQELLVEAFNFSARTTQFTMNNGTTVTSAGSTISFKDSSAAASTLRKRVSVAWFRSTGIPSSGGGTGGGTGGTDFLAQATADQFTSNAGTSPAPNEGHPHGVPSGWDFYSSAFVGDGNNPCKSVTPCNTTMAMTYWGVIYADAAGNPATNVRVNVKACKSYWYDTSNHTWNFNGPYDAPEAEYYAEDYSSGGTAANVRTESDGSVSIKPQTGSVAHWFGPFPRMTFTKANFGGIVNVCQMRLVVDNTGLTDDRASAKLLGGVGGDFYPSATGAGIQNNPGIGGGKFKYISNNWRSFAMSTLSYNAIKALPAQPPIDLTGLDP